MDYGGNSTDTWAVSQGQGYSTLRDQDDRREGSFPWARRFGKMQARNWCCLLFLGVRQSLQPSCSLVNLNVRHSWGTRCRWSVVVPVLCLCRLSYSSPTRSSLPLRSAYRLGSRMTKCSTYMPSVINHLLSTSTCSYILRDGAGGFTGRWGAYTRSGVKLVFVTLFTLTTVLSSTPDSLILTHTHTHVVTHTHTHTHPRRDQPLLESSHCPPA